MDNTPDIDLGLLAAVLAVIGYAEFFTQDHKQAVQLPPPRTYGGLKEFDFGGCF